MILGPLVILDTETTGTSAAYDRIIEIALVRFEEGVEVSRWQTLVNPGVTVSPFITSLTGITNDMVKAAPSFEDIAADLHGYLEGATLAAHNAKFDYGFLKAEYARMGAVLRLKLLCTVRLSRKLYPEHKGHGLDAIMRRHGLTTNHRHRAMGDVELVIDYMKLAIRDLSQAYVWNVINELTKGPRLPPGLDADFLDKIPEGPGVYIFYGESTHPLYIGKSVTLRARVLSHFSSDHSSTKEMAIVQEVRRVEWIETAGELGALLLESKLIKEMQPAYNRMLRYSRKLFSLRLAQGLNETPLVKLVTDDDIHPGIFEYLYGMFKTKKGAMDT
ncbi:MAG: exonuclease domain-containing protein, partial [Methylophilaceae bacterium]|nr:exonuclease domain-containing protein [Methylophilaceae bacterium]